jgi:hypothetical protein
VSRSTGAATFYRPELEAQIGGASVLESTTEALVEPVTGAALSQGKSARSADLRSWTTRLLSRIRADVSLFLLGAGAASVFLANIVAKNVFTEVQFVDWAYLTSLVAFFFSFSLLGSEQLIIRLARNDQERLEIPRSAARLLIISFLAFLLVYAFVLDGRLFEYRLGVTAVPILLSVGVIQLVYQVERARGHLFGSQFVVNSWKLALLPLVFVAAWLVPTRRAELAIGGALLVGLIASGAILRSAWMRLDVRAIKSDAHRVFVPFMLSLGTMALLGILDRSVLEKVHDPAKFAGYVYMTTLLVTPFNIFSSYVGFREAVRYRRAYSSTSVRADTLRITVITTGLVIVWFVLCFLTRRLTHLPLDYGLWVVMGLISVVRCGYGVLSAAMGVRGSAGAMYTANALTVGAIAFYAIVAVGLGVSVTMIAVGYLAVWVVRFGAYFGLITKFPSETEEAATPVAA